MVGTSTAVPLIAIIRTTLYIDGPPEPPGDVPSPSICQPTRHRERSRASGAVGASAPLGLVRWVSEGHRCQIRAVRLLRSQWIVRIVKLRVKCNLGRMARLQQINAGFSDCSDYYNRRDMQQFLCR